MHEVARVRRRARLVLAIIASACLLLTIPALAIDLELARAIAGARSEWVVGACSAATYVGAYLPVFVAALAITAVLLITLRSARATLPALAVALAIVVNASLKLLFERPRPGGELAAVEAANYAMPSGHAAGTAALGAALVLAVAGLRQMPIVIGAVVLMVPTIAATRPCLGVHWVSDILAGAAVGTGCALVIDTVVRTGARERIEQAPGEATSADVEDAG